MVDQRDYLIQKIREIDWIDITNNSLAQKETSKNDKELLRRLHVIEENKVDSLRINMTKEQIIFLLGEPVVNNIFNKKIIKFRC